jgi:CRISPR/Cas system-associated protein Cas7 (RAMP superfamily)
MTAEIEVDEKRAKALLKVLWPASSFFKSTDFNRYPKYFESGFGRDSGIERRL